jgi:MFS transporter, FHS family, glucose/mannose:H+ symporter
MKTKSTLSIFLSAYLGMLLFGISLTTLGSVAPVLREKFSMDPIAFGTLFSILPFGILSGSLLFGPFADKYGYKVILLLAGAAMFVGFQGIAYADSITPLKICVFLFGLGGGAINGSTNAIVSDISDKNKSANLSLLGVFFAAGALGMPFVLGILERQFPFEVIIAGVGYVALISTLVFFFTRFPEAKQAQGLSWEEILKLSKDSFLLVVGFFLFCQSSFEAIINNWTTTYLLNKLPITMSAALYALSLYVVGMAVMRILLGKLLRVIKPRTIMMASVGLLFIGCVLIQFSTSYLIATAGLVILGSGLAAGYPVTLGFVGDRYAAVSGTAFSIVISVGLIGSMIINYIMGIIVEHYNIQHLVTMGFILTGCMLLFLLIIFKKLSL